jgi:hypothetical protein
VGEAIVTSVLYNLPRTRQAVFFRDRDGRRADRKTGTIEGVLTVGDTGRVILSFRGTVTRMTLSDGQWFITEVMDNETHDAILAALDRGTDGVQTAADIASRFAGLEE